MDEYFLIKDIIYKEYYCQSKGGIWTFMKNINNAFKFNSELDAEKKILYLFKHSMRVTHYLIIKKNN